MLELGIGQGPRGPAGAVPEKGVMPNQQDAPLARILLSKKRASMPAKQEACQHASQARSVPAHRQARSMPTWQTSKKHANVADKQGLCQHSRHASC